jgi:hypothetical protein
MDMLSAVRFVRTAEAAGFNPEILALLEGSGKLKYEVKDGKGYVTPEEGKAQLLTDYAAKTWPEFLKSLTTNTAEEKRPVAGIDAAIARNRATATASNPLRKGS